MPGLAVRTGQVSRVRCALLALCSIVAAEHLPFPIVHGDLLVPGLGLREIKVVPGPGAFPVLGSAIPGLVVADAGIALLTLHPGQA